MQGAALSAPNAKVGIRVCVKGAGPHSGPGMLLGWKTKMTRFGDTSGDTPTPSTAAHVRTHPTARVRVNSVPYTVHPRRDPITGWRCYSSGGDILSVVHFVLDFLLG